LLFSQTSCRCAIGLHPTLLATLFVLIQHIEHIGFFHDGLPFELPSEFHHPTDGIDRRLQGNKIMKLPKQEYTAEFKEQAAAQVNSRRSIGAVTKEWRKVLGWRATAEVFADYLLSCGYGRWRRPVESVQ
jgi:hypothetical protein